MSTAGASERLQFDYRLDAGVAVVTATGEADVTTCGLVRSALLRALTEENCRGLVVNLASVSFIDSTGIGVLVGIWRRVRDSNGRLALAAPSRQVQRILDTAGLTKVLSVYDLEVEAVQACRQPAGG